MSLTTLNSYRLETKEHFKILDGLRGIAAIVVVIFHFMEFVVPDYNKCFIAHAYLAVDFFFCLSGFVIAYAYDNKIKDIGKVSFFKLRLIRLHPLVIIGSILGLASFAFDPFSSLFNVYGIVYTALMFITSCFLIPFPLVHERYFNLFHLNPPTWSLFWEYVANVFYAFVLCKINKRILWILTVVGAIALCYEAKRSGFLSVGWGGDNVIGGGIRVFYSFLIGIVIYRSRWIIKSKLGFVPVGILLLIAFLTPYRDTTTWFVDPLLVILYLPLVVALGAGAHLRPAMEKPCKFSGNISYPLYVIHYPFLWLFYSYIEKYKPSMNQMVIIIPFATLFLIFLAYIVLVHIDSPIRNYFKKRLLKAI